ncbi:hypothetical protein BJV78DRAFT_277528 [Lactifluus subvellereus]|nr:hypothetical protein BJV78DRAFT_277528 [Lactifluus subvellereus]
MSQAENILRPHADEYMYITSICHLSAIVLLYYDYALTLSREIQFFWPPHNKQGWFSLTCLLNRYIPVFGYLPFVVSYCVPESFPGPTNIPWDHCGDLAVTCWHTLPNPRVCVVWPKSPHPGTSSRARVRVDYPGGCLRSRGDTVLVASSLHDCILFSPPLGGLYNSLAWIGVLIFDSVIFSLTLYKALAIGRGIQLLDVIVRDGTMYFSVLFIVNLVNILMLRFFPPSLKHCTSTLTNVLSAILASRLVLNLREQHCALAGLSTTVKTELRFQAAPPAAPPMTSLQIVTFVRAEESTLGTARNSVDGASC